MLAMQITGSLYSSYMTIICIIKHRWWVSLMGGVILWNAPARGAEGPFFVTYAHQLEEPGNLEFATKSITGDPSGGNAFVAGVAEFEYGAKAWWTTELYVDAQSTRNEAAFMNGVRWENRFRLLPREHWINPVLYVEFEDVNGADKGLLEVVGHDSVEDLTAPNAEARAEKQHEIETKLLLGSYFKGWTIAENIIAEKNLGHEAFEFGYAAGVSRPVALAAKPETCNLCPENFQVGVEMYGGLGTNQGFGLHETSHYVAPTFAWSLANGTIFRLSPTFGLTDTSARFLLRFGVAYEVAQFGRTMARLFHQGGAQ